MSLTSQQKSGIVAQYRRVMLVKRHSVGLMLLSYAIRYIALIAAIVALVCDAPTAPTRDDNPL